MSYQDSKDYDARLAKAKEMVALGIDPYPRNYSITTSVELLLKKKVEESFNEALEENTEKVRVAGRIVLYRNMGKNSFVHLQESGYKVQVIFSRGFTCVKGLQKDHHLFLKKQLDLGDFVGVEGYLCRTKKGELSVVVKELVVLTKSLLPLPDKHHKLKDKEICYRKRWLDILTNTESMEKFKLRSKILGLIRKFFDKEEFLEVETPILETLYGGAHAEPFKSKLNCYNMDIYMRIATEISLKKLMVGGFTRVYEMGKVFRNEGMDSTHNPEFTSLEAYASYKDYNYTSSLVEKLYSYLAKTIFGSTEIVVGNEKLDFGNPWIRISMIDAIKKYGNIVVADMDNKEMEELLVNEGNVEKKNISGASRGILISTIFDKFVEDKLISPHFVTDYPVETTPFCKTKIGNDSLVDRFEGFVLGQEICNGYSELNDPILQRKLLEEQDRLNGIPLDESFMEAISQGMPPCSGVGIGIDRLVMLFLKESSIRDVLFFPMLKSTK